MGLIFEGLTELLHLEPGGIWDGECGAPRMN